jgi:hypothetical protein
MREKLTPLWHIRRRFPKLDPSQTPVFHDRSTNKKFLPNLLNSFEYTMCLQTCTVSRANRKKYKLYLLPSLQLISFSCREGEGVSVRTAEEDSWVQNPTRNPKNNVDSALQRLIMADVKCDVQNNGDSSPLSFFKTEKWNSEALYTWKLIYVSSALRIYLWYAYSKTLINIVKYNSTDL